MSINTKLLAARRRNHQARYGKDFLHSLSEKAGLPANLVQFLEAQSSIILQQSVYERLRVGIHDGTILRMIHLTLTQAVEKCRENLPKGASEEVVLLFNNYSDFPVKCPMGAFVESLSRLIVFDGDSVTAVVDEGRTGVCLDVETEITGDARYELDFWGDWSGPVASPR
jgi:hypothetical protein